MDHLHKTINFKPKQDAVKQEVDRNEDMIRSALRTIASLHRIRLAPCFLSVILHEFLLLSFVSVPVLRDIDELSNACYICYCAAVEIAALSSRTLRMKYRKLLHSGTSIVPSETNDGLIETPLCFAACQKLSIENDCIIILTSAS